MGVEANGLTGRYSESKHREEVMDKTGKKREPGIRERVEGVGLSLGQKDGGKLRGSRVGHALLCLYMYILCGHVCTRLY